MFKQEYNFYGSHANKVKTLVSKFADFPGAALFQRNVDVLLFAPIVGFLYGKKSQIDKSTTQTTKIFVEQMIKEDLSIKFNYQLITLLDKNNKISSQERIDRAFRFIGTSNYQNELDLFNEYILGGVDVLYEKLIEPAKTEKDYLPNLYDFLEAINDRYNQEINENRISELLALARSQE